MPFEDTKQPRPDRQERRPDGAILLLTLCLALALAGSPPSSAQLMVAESGGSSALIALPANASGDTVPLRTIQGQSTLLRVPEQLAIDPVHQEVFVGSISGDLLVFPLNGNGDIAPTRVIHPANARSVALDLAHDELFAVSYDSDTVSVYARTASGAATPLRTIAGPATQLSGVAGIAVDLVHGEILVTDNSSGRILVFRRADHGNVAPLRVLAGPHTLLQEPFGIALDLVHDEIVVADQVGALSVFPRAAHGDTAPLRHIAGSNTALRSETIGVTLLSDTEYAVASPGKGGFDYSDDRVLVFSRTATGNVPPLRSIGGDNHPILAPAGVGVISMVLNRGRFFVEATWRTPDKSRGIATAQNITSDTGYLWFFSDQNVEAVVKVLDGCANNGRFWVFAGGLTNVFTSLKVTDLASGQVKVYTNPLNTAFQPIQDTGAFATCGTAWTDREAPEQIAERAPEPPVLPAAALVAPTAACTGLCLSSNRYQVTATWQTASDSGTATGVKLTDDTGYLWFFGSSNVEVVVKVLNGCLVNNHVWVFAGGLTNVQVTLKVHDTLTGHDATYINPQGSAFQPVQDTGAFAVCS